MRLFSSKHETNQVYIDKNRKIQWIWATLDKASIQNLLLNTKLLKKIIFLALISGTMVGIILSIIY